MDNKLISLYQVIELALVLTTAQVASIDLDLVNVSTYWALGRHVYHMELDQLSVDKIIFSPATSLQTTDGESTDTIVGSLNQGYQEGTYGDVIFHTVTSFTQVNSTMIVVVDSDNHCLRTTDRNTQTTALFSGECTNSGYADGDKMAARYDMPYSVIHHNDQLYITDSNNKAIRITQLADGSVQTLCKNDTLDRIYGLVVEPNGQFFFATVYSGLVKIDIESGAISMYTSTESGFNDGAASSAQFEGPRGMAWLSDKILAVADHGNEQVRLVDVESSDVKSLSSATEIDATSERIHLIPPPISLLNRNSTLLISTDIGITTVQFLEGKLTTSTVAATPTPDEMTTCKGKDCKDPNGKANVVISAGLLTSCLIILIGLF